MAQDQDPVGERRTGLTPTTRLGRASVWLAVAFVAMFAINMLVFMPTSSSDAAWRHTVLPYFGVAMMTCGLAAGIVGAIALIRRRERSPMVWLTVAPGLFVLTFLLGEFLFPH